MRKKFALTLSLVGFFMLGASPAQATQIHSNDTLPTRNIEIAEHEPLTLGTTTYASYYPGGTNSEEFWFCTNPLNAGSCGTAKSLADHALAKAQEKFSADSLYQGKGDAYRHCYWNASMTVEMGSDTAKGFADRHESDSPDGADKDMDLKNNETGRKIGKNTGDTQASSDQCETLAKQGKLVTLK